MCVNSKLEEFTGNNSATNLDQMFQLDETNEIKLKIHYLFTEKWKLFYV